SVSYPRVKDHRDQIHKIIDLEVKRYEETKVSGRRIVSQLLQKSKNIEFKTLVDLYQNNGINPLMIKELAKEKNVDVDVPADFYIRIEEYLSKQTTKKVKTNELEGLKVDKDLATNPLYYTDVYETKFTAKVVNVVDNYNLILDQTLFYPTGGGQIHDTGKISVGNKEYTVIDVFKIGTTTIHKLKEKCDLTKGIEVNGEIDGKRRLAIMRHHSAVHVVNNAAKEVLGEHIWQAGADKTPKKARLDITHYQAISFEELQKIENLANQVVFEHRLIEKSKRDRDAAERDFGFHIYQGGVVPGKVLNIVSINAWDIEACGGTHLDNTADIGIIKLVGSERIQDGIVRLDILAGDPALNYIQNQEKILKEASNTLSVEPKILPKTVDRFFKEWKEQKKTIDSLNKKIAEVQYASTKVESKKIKTTDVIVQETTGNQKELIVRSSAAVKNFDDGVCILIASDDKKVTIVGCRSKQSKANIVEIVKELSLLVGGSGGGKGDLALGGGPNLEKVNDVMTQIYKIIESNIS
ncbi:MAG: alanine--tRNA ligase-related protein, partial [Candidatus Heimdallarchaeaceae archaeon]